MILRTVLIWGLGLLFNVCLLFGQSHFDFLFIPEPPYENSMSMTSLGIVGDGYGLYGAGLNTAMGGVVINFTKVDTLGNINWRYRVDLSETNQSTGSNFYAITTADTSVYLINNATWDTISGFVATRIEKIDKDGNLLWYKRFNDEKTRKFQLRSKGGLPNETGGGITIFGQDYTLEGGLIRAKIGDDGTLLRYDTTIVPLVPNGSIGRRLTAAHDGNGGHYVAYGKGGIGGLERSFVAHIDSVGNLLNARYLNARSLRRIRRHPDGDLAYLTFNWNPDADNPNYGEPLLMSLDGESLDTNWTLVNEGEIIDFQDSVFGFFNYSYAADMLINRNGEIVTQHYFNPRLMGLQWYNMEGNLLRQRFIHIRDELFPGSTGENYRYEHLVETPEGGLLLGGYLIWRHPDTFGGGLQNLILLKLDSLGCVEPGCQNDTLNDLTIFTDVLEPARPDLAGELEVVLYPNPTSDEIRLRSLDPATRLPAFLDYRIFDQEGRPLQSGTLYPANGLDVRKLGSGYYYLQLRSEDGAMKTIGFLIQ